jgi:hypothetical protein
MAGHVVELVNPDRVIPTNADCLEMAAMLHELADRAAKGDFWAIAIAAVQSDDMIHVEHYKMPGATMTELLGAMYFSTAEFAKAIQVCED